MREVKQISFLDHVELLGTANHIVLVSPSDVAQKFGCYLEKSYDNLGEFEFVGVKMNEVLFGFRRFTDDKNVNYSYTSVVGADKDDKTNRILELLGVGPEKVQKFDDLF